MERTAGYHRARSVERQRRKSAMSHRSTMSGVVVQSIMLRVQLRLTSQGGSSE